MSKQAGGKQKTPTVLSEEAFEQLKRRRFQIRVEHVLAVMKEERIDFRGVPAITQDGRIGVQVVPVEMQAGL